MKVSDRYRAGACDYLPGIYSRNCVLWSWDPRDLRICEVMDQLKPRRCNHPTMRRLRASAESWLPPRAHCSLTFCSRCSLASLVMPHTISSSASSPSSSWIASSVLVNTFSRAVATSSSPTPRSFSSCTHEVYGLIYPSLSNAVHSYQMSLGSQTMEHNQEQIWVWHNGNGHAGFNDCTKRGSETWQSLHEEILKLGTSGEAESDCAWFGNRHSRLKHIQWNLSYWLGTCFRRWGPQQADRHRDRTKASAYSTSLCNPLPSKKSSHISL